MVLVVVAGLVAMAACSESVSDERQIVERFVSELAAGDPSACRRLTSAARDDLRDYALAATPIPRRVLGRRRRVRRGRSCTGAVALLAPLLRSVAPRLRDELRTSSIRHLGGDVEISVGPSEWALERVADQYAIDGLNPLADRLPAP